MDASRLANGPAVMTLDIHATALFAGPDRGTLENVVLRHDNGVITSIEPSAAPPPAPRTFVIPAFVNAHDHARPTASSFGAVDMPLESWIIRSAFGTPPDRAEGVDVRPVQRRATGPATACTQLRRGHPGLFCCDPQHFLCGRRA